MLSTRTLLYVAKVKEQTTAMHSA